MATLKRSPYETILLRAALVALRDHRNRPHLRDVGDFFAAGARAAAGEDEQRLPILAAERARDDAARRRNHAEVLAVLRDHFNAGVGRHVKPALRVDRAAVAAPAGQLR